MISSWFLQRRRRSRFFLILMLLAVLNFNVDAADDGVSDSQKEEVDFKFHRKDKKNWEPKSTEDDPSKEIDPGMFKISIDPEILDKYQQRLDPIVQDNAEITADLNDFLAHNFAVVGPMVLCKPGKFFMGSPAKERGRRKNEVYHKVTLTRPFLLGTFEVVNIQYKVIMGENPDVKDPAALKPKTEITWAEATEICRRLNAVFQIYLPKGYEIGLPTEAEWEYACRAGTTTPYSSFLSSAGWHEANTKEDQDSEHPNAIQQVGRLRPNHWGLFDMHGNALEWCYDDYLPWKKGAATDPVYSGVTTCRVVRGGSWGADAHLSRSARRDFAEMSLRSPRIGFRLAVRPIIDHKTGKFLPSGKISQTPSQTAKKKLPEEEKNVPRRGSNDLPPKTKYSIRSSSAAAGKAPVFYASLGKNQTISESGTAMQPGGCRFALDPGLGRIAGHFEQSSRQASLTAVCARVPAGKRPFSLSCWVKIPKFTVNGNVLNLFGFGSSPQQFRSLAVCPASGRFHFGNGRWSISSRTSARAGQWYCLIGTFDGTLSTLYINGQAVDQTDSLVFSSGNDTASNSKIAVGNCWTKDNLALSTAEIKIYDYALSASQIEAEYQRLLNSHQRKKGTAPADSDTPSATSGALKISGQFDGVGVFLFSGNQITYQHRSLKMPNNVTVNGKPWSDLNQPLTLPRNCDYSEAKLQVVRGRGFVVEMNDHADLRVEIDDHQDDAGEYELLITGLKSKNFGN